MQTSAGGGHFDFRTFMFPGVIAMTVLFTSVMSAIVPELFLMAFAMSALGIVIAGRIEQIQSFGVVVQFLVMPMFFLSGAIFPLSSRQAAVDLGIFAAFGVLMLAIAVAQFSHND